MSGWVYFMANPAMPGLYKIGRTGDHPHDRAKKLSRPTGVPCDFSVVYAVLVPDPKELEAATHRHYADRRVSGRREFFRFDLGEDLLTATDWLGVPQGSLDYIRVSVAAG